MAVVSYWDGSTLPTIALNPSSVTVDQSAGKPAPAFRFDAGTAAYATMSVSTDTASVRFWHRLPDINSVGLRILEFGGVWVTHQNANRLGMSLGGGVGWEYLTVAPGSWVAIEVNLTSRTAGRIRVWDDAGVRIYDRSGTVTAATRYRIGTASSGSGATGRGHHIDDVTVTNTADDIAPPAATPPGVKLYTGGAWAERPAKVYQGGVWVAMPVRYYGGPGWLTEAARIDAATTVTGVQQVLEGAASAYGVTITISDSTAGIGAYTAPTTIDDGYIKTAAKALLAALRRYPAGMFADGGWQFYLGRALVVNGTEVSGAYAHKKVSINTDMTDYGLQMLPDRYHAGIFCVHHELAHGFWQYRAGAALSTFQSEMTAAQPAGFSWLGSGYDAPYTGEHPVGFPRAYGRLDANEDQADILGWVLTDYLWERDGATWFVDDSHLAAKAAAARKWLTSLGVTGL